MNSPFTDFTGSTATEELNDVPVNEMDFETPFVVSESADLLSESDLETDEIDLETGTTVSRSEMNSENFQDNYFTEPFVAEELSTDEVDEISDEPDDYRGVDFETDLKVEETFSDEHLAEMEWEVKPSAADFNLVSVERHQMGTTIYINPDLRIKNTNQCTGIFIPSSFVPTANFELIIYLHGYKFDTARGLQACYKDICPSTTIQTYWKSSMFLLREALHQSGRESILVAPTLGLRSESGTLILDRGFDLFINQVLRALLTERIVDAAQRPGRVVLAAHSGGGLPMQRITMLNDNYSKLVKECWCFDSLYGDVSGY